MKDNSWIVVLVGGPSTGKTHFYTNFTSAAYHWPTVKITPNVAFYSEPSFVMIDTPGLINYRREEEYSWQGIFAIADVVVVFENWTEDEIYGKKLDHSPKFMTWSGDNQETLKRIQEYLQGRK
jgi:ribosome-interacting GTPase 1